MTEELTGLQSNNRHAPSCIFKLYVNVAQAIKNATNNPIHIPNNQPFTLMENAFLLNIYNISQLTFINFSKYTSQINSHTYPDSSRKITVKERSQRRELGYNGAGASLSFEAMTMTKMSRTGISELRVKKSRSDGVERHAISTYKGTSQKMIQNGDMYEPRSGYYEVVG